MRIISVLLTFSVLCAPLSLRAETVDGATHFAAALGSRCTTDVSSIFSSSDFAAILQEYPVDKNKICACAETMVLSDKKMSDYLNTEQQTLTQRLKSPLFRAYAGLRFTGAMFACSGPEIDASLEKSVLPQ